MFKPVKLGLVFALSLALGSQTIQAQTENLKDKVDKTKPKIAIVLGGKRLGIVAGFLTKERAEALKLGEKRGVLVREVIKDSSADRAGLKSGDVIVEIDGQVIESHRDLRNKLEKIDYGKSTSLKIIRDGAPQQLSFTLEKSNSDNFYAYAYGENNEEVKKALEKSKEARKKALQESRQSLEKYRAEMDKARAERRAEGHARGENELHYFSFGRPRLGVQTQELTEQLGKYFGLEKGKGALISHVSEDSPGAKAGLLAGDVITEINGVTINHTGDLRRELNKVESGEVRLTVFRNRQRIELRAILEAKAKLGENFNFEFPPDFPLGALPNFDGKVLVLPEFKEFQNLPKLQGFPEMQFDFDSNFLTDLDIYL